MEAFSGWAGVAAVLLGAVALLAAVTGTLVYLSHRRSAAPAARRPSLRKLPAQWPLLPRPLANSAERQAWRWLMSTFPEHHIVPKLPLTRFTQPMAADTGREWFEMLSGAYCSFTICDDEARVIGCVDLVGPQGLARGNQQLKQTLLSQCGIGYWPIAPGAYPSAQAIRTDFLGAHAADPNAPTRTSPAELQAVRDHLHQVLDRGRGQRQARADAGNSGEAVLTPWPQPDSFLGALDSRSGELVERR